MDQDPMTTGPATLPIARPGKVICVGLNYRDHAAEAGKELPTRPMLFAKLTSSLIGPDQAIELPPIPADIDYEAELGVVIGERVKGVGTSAALDYVAGYVCFNDVTARDIQRADGQWMRGKSFDTFGPVGPMVPASEVGDPQELGLTCSINGKVVQKGSTADMVFSVAEIIAFVSQAITLEEGDLIATGTPGGIGAFHTPPRWLKPFDVVEVAIDRVGVLRNPVV
jgi:2-keto-4-pentenoate hydratase/2-oxohepta-3-ene-1,7-dioic acid hydratase in catechol pathway